MRVLVIGDIHGAVKALLQVLQRSNFNPNEDQLIFLGDYVDRQPDSALVIQYLIDLEKQCTHPPIYLKGNHDEWCRQWLNTGIKEFMWVSQGGKATIDSYLKTDLMNNEHRSFFNKLHNYYIDDQNRGFVHGGFVSRKGLGHDPYISNYYWDRDLWSLARIFHDNPSSKYTESELRFKKHTEIYIGHTTTTYWNSTVPMNKCNVWNLDTGAGHGDKLTIMDIDTKEFWQSDLISELYPENI